MVCVEELEPNWKMMMFERLGAPGEESSNGFNNAGQHGDEAKQQRQALDMRDLWSHRLGAREIDSMFQKVYTEAELHQGSEEPRWKPEDGDHRQGGAPWPRFDTCRKLREACVRAVPVQPPVLGVPHQERLPAQT